MQRRPSHARGSPLPGSIARIFGVAIPAGVPAHGRQWNNARDQRCRRENDACVEDMIADERMGLQYWEQKINVII